MDIKQDNIQLLLSTHSFKFESVDVNENLTCVLCKKLMINAYQTYCGCQYCRGCIVVYLSNDNVYCCGGKEECKEEYLILEENVFCNAMLNKKISKTKVICPNDLCAYVDELNKIQFHMNICSKKEIQCPYLSIGCNEKSSKEKILTHLHNEAVSHAEMLLDIVHNLKNEMGNLKEIFESIKEKLGEKEIEIESIEQENNFKEIENGSLKRKLTRIRNELDIKEERIVALEEDSAKRTRMEGVYRMTIGRLLKTNRGGNITFTVDKFSEQKTSKQHIYTPYFYSHTNGYKLRLEVYPGGSGTGKGTHFSVFFDLCKGEYDDVLPWPCKYSFNISIINQSSGESIQNGLISYDRAEETRNFFNKPNTVDNGLGFPQWISHEILQSREGAIVNDSIIIKCVIIPPKC